MTMQGYIVCEKKGNFPRIHVKICQQRCQDTDTCAAYQDFMKTHCHEDMVMPSSGPAISSEKVFAPPTL
jgi:hypothetical protein